MIHTQIPAADGALSVDLAVALIKIERAVQRAADVNATPEQAQAADEAAEHYRAIAKDVFARAFGAVDPAFFAKAVFP